MTIQDPTLDRAKDLRIPLSIAVIEAQRTQVPAYARVDVSGEGLGAQGKFKILGQSLLFATLRRAEPLCIAIWSVLSLLIKY